METAPFWINKLGLTPHPEGGYFREIYRSKEILSSHVLNQRYTGDRNLATSIYFLLPSGEVSKFHRLKSDEIWYFHYGSSLIVHVFYEGKYIKYAMGSDISKEEQLQLIIPAGAIFGAEVIGQNYFSLVGCMVAPGFHFSDFELIRYPDIISSYPELKGLILRFT
jgi:uncharacterized protein